MNEKHACTIGSDFLSDDYDVTCSCGFTVEGLSSFEAAQDTVRWHLGEPSALGEGVTS